VRQSWRRALFLMLVLWLGGCPQAGDQPRQERHLDAVHARSHLVPALVRTVRSADHADLVPQAIELARLGAHDGLGPALEVRVEVLGDQDQLHASLERSAASSPSGSPSGRNASP